MKRKLGVALATAALAGFALVGPGSASSEFKNKYDDAALGGVCNDFGDKLEYFGPLKMWPPNHKMQDVEFVATSSNEQESVSVTVLDVVDDALDGGDGGPQHGPDVAYTDGSPTAAGTGSATLPMQLRSERSGRGDGREYDLTATATYGGVAGIAGRTCTLEVTVVVPHDMRGGADWNTTEGQRSE